RPVHQRPAGALPQEGKEDRPVWDAEVGGDAVSRGELATGGLLTVVDREGEDRARVPPGEVGGDRRIEAAREEQDGGWHRWGDVSPAALAPMPSCRGFVVEHPRVRSLGG